MYKEKDSSSAGYWMLDVGCCGVGSGYVVYSGQLRFRLRKYVL